MWVFFNRKSDRGDFIWLNGKAIPCFHGSSRRIQSAFREKDQSLNVHGNPLSATAGEMRKFVHHNFVTKRFAIRRRICVHLNACESASETIIKYEMEK